MATLRASKSGIKSSESKNQRGLSEKEAGEGGVKKSMRFGSMLSSGIKGLMGRVPCEICEEDIKKLENGPCLSNCEHRFNFC